MILSKYRPQTGRLTNVVILSHGVRMFYRFISLILCTPFYSAEQVANALIDLFHHRMQSYPLKCFGFGVTMVKNHSLSEVSEHYLFIYLREASPDPLH